MGRIVSNVGLVLLFCVIGGIAAYFTNYAGIKDWVDINFFSRPPHWQQPNNDPGGIFGEPKPQPQQTDDDKETFVDNTSNSFVTNSVPLAN